jgi:SOS-response transcriptional repressor LexA
MLRRAGLADAPVARTLAPGFSESDAAPWIAADTDTGRAIARALGADRPGIDVWEVRSLAMGLQGYLPGDHILVDTHQAERVKAGDVVIAQIYDHARALAYTVMRRWEPPVLVAASADPADRRVHVVDGVNAVIRGRVCACWRQAA